MLDSLKKATGRVLIFAGALALFAWGYLFLQELWFEKAATQVLEQQLLSSSRVGQRKAKHNLAIVAAKPGQILGRIEIPRIHLSAMVLEGVDSNTLRFGAGHVQGTALPGVKGNIAIAAHRDTFFRPLRNVRPNDTILLTTIAGVYHYKVERTEIVDPTDVQVLNRTKDSQLTLVTCYPFYYLGSAPKRFIVHTRLQS
jgi:sortase A